jgi:hypothetical protein
MVLERKIYKKLLEWKNESKGTKALMDKYISRG